MNLWHDFDEKKIQPSEFHVITEIERDTKVKYEIDKDTGLLKLDRVLSTSLRFPGNYGFMPKTLSEDGDPLDVFIIMHETVKPMTMVKCAPIGYIEMIDNDEADEKILAVPLYKGSYFAQFTDINEIPQNFINEVVHFLRVYKDLEKDNRVEIRGVHNRAAAEKIIIDAKARYNRAFPKKR
ncbi:MAG: inorganic diphosphatase [Firmicutes bacterium]|nr:inorganic diphosphatase [Bacillota bacterium]